MMSSIHSFLLPIHIFAGFVSLILFWLPIFTKKGGSIHVKIGKIYIWLMWIVVVTAAIMSITNAFTGNEISAAFLGFLSVITAKPLWQGIQILKYKKELPKSYYQKSQILNTIIVLAGVGLLVLAYTLQFKDQAILLLIFGILGVSTIFDLKKSFAKTAEQSNWFLDHMASMIITGIAAYTAFLAFGGYSLFPAIYDTPFVTVFWVTPTIIGSIAIAYMTRKHKKAAKV